MVKSEEVNVFRRGHRGLSRGESSPKGFFACLQLLVSRSETGKCVPHEKRGAGLSGGVPPCAQVVIDGPADGSVVLLPRVTETEFKAQAKRAPPFWSGFKHETPSLRRESLRTDWMRCRLGHVAPRHCESMKKGQERDEKSLRPT